MRGGELIYHQVCRLLEILSLSWMGYLGVGCVACCSTSLLGQPDNMMTHYMILVGPSGT